jgi:DNA helicase-2/ATP-dependent DNA helicase PcrA
VPAYVIFTDATLQAIAEQEPGSVSRLSAVSGVGSVKLDRYGEAVLALVAGRDPEETVAGDGEEEDE